MLKVCMALRGEAAQWPADADAGAFLQLALEHGVQPLLYRRLRESGMLPQWPAQVQETLKSAMLQQVALDLVTESEVRKALEALASAGVKPLLLKGTPLSVTHYPEPGLRPRTDTDLLIDHGELPALEAALRPLGYEPANAVTGDIVSHQRMYAGRITFDVHWKLFNPVLLASLIPAGELHARAVAAPQFGPHARTPCPAHALLLACIHRAGHHPGQSDRLIWLYDIHLLASQMSAAEFEDFARMAAEKRVRTLCLDALDSARDCFHTTLFEDPLRRHLHVPDAASEPSAQYLRPRLSRLDLWKMDFRQLHGRERMRLLREHLFPPAEYMRRKYGVRSPVLLPVLYVRRIVAGAWRMVRKKE